MSHEFKRIDTKSTTAGCTMRNIIPSRSPLSKGGWGDSRFAVSGTPTPNSKGFSLIEIIITLVVLSIAAVGVLSVFSSGMRGSADPLILSQAVHLAQEKMDVIIADRRNPARGYAWVAPANYPAETPVAGFAGFDRAVNIFCVAPADLNTSIGAPPCAGGHTRVTVTITHAVTGNVAVDGLVTDY